MMSTCAFVKHFFARNSSKTVLVLSAALSLSACGSDDSPSTAVPAPSGAMTASTAQGAVPAGAPRQSAGGNQAPTISGKPSPSVLQGGTFDFEPVVRDREGDRLLFAVANKPPWAIFDHASGRLYGRPGAADIGRYANVQITVSDGRSTVALPAFHVDVVATAGGAVNVSWVPPTERIDGSPLFDLAGYTVHWGPAPDDFSHSARIENPGVTLYMIENLTPATWYVVVTAFDSQGIESDFSDVASLTIL